MYVRAATHRGMFGKGKAYSDDLRWRIVQMKAIYMSDSAIAAHFLVSKPRDLFRGVHVERFISTVTPSVKRNGLVCVLILYEDILIHSILDNPTTYLHEVQQQLQIHGVSPSPSTISRHLKRMGFS